MNEALVELENVSRVYDQAGQNFFAVKSVSCRVMPGEKIVIVGNSGSGKSTLLNLMAGLETPTGGRISWPKLGAVQNLRPSHISMIFQTPALVPSLDVAENILIPLLLGPETGTGIEAAQTMLEYFRLGELALKLPEELSGGQQQRVAVARGTVKSTPLILADEPTGQLDRNSGDILLEKLLELTSRRNAALVLATHDPEVTRHMDHVWRMAHGSLIKEAGE